MIQLQNMNLKSNSNNSNTQFVASLYKESHPKLFGYLLKSLRSKQDAQDLSQEAYLRLLRVDQVKLIDNPQAYLFRIAVNLIYELRIRSNGNKALVTDSLDDVEELISSNDPQSAFEISDAIAQLEKTVKELPAVYQSILLMRKRDGLSHTEISKILNISIHTVRKYLTRAVTECRKRAIPDNHDEK